VWDRPSNSCLASRVPWGTKVTAERLCRIELAETVVKNSTGARQVRVRDIGGAARIEVGKKDIDRILNSDVVKMLDKPLRLIGFTSVTIDTCGYVPGGANVVTD
ncbi:MAG: ATP-utilizing protein, partial [Cenarchaeum symbiont of Oopsacas minuta]|nr:ATP-utilizing protein [Cenarchaeum symbiont of Oopsacas minuta]